MTDRELMQQALDALELLAKWEHPASNITTKTGGRIYPQRVATDAAAPLRERLAQPEQEPVAWIDEFGNVFPLGAQRGPKYLNEPMKPLYTSPPQRKPLTDEVIWLEYQRFWPFHPAEEPKLAKDIVKFARAIEAKLREKNT